MNMAVLKNQMPREKWANRIAAAWQKQVPSIFEVGGLLEAAKAELKRGEWITMRSPLHSSMSSLSEFGAMRLWVPS